MMKQLWVVVLGWASLLGVVDGLLGIGRTQSVAVSGRLLCDGVPVEGVKLKLYEKEFILDSLLSSGVTDRNGQFQLSGWKREISTIDPKLNIYHRCNYNGICYKKVGITIPDAYISRGRVPQRTYDVGTLNLGNKYNGVTTDCLN